jgi:hypothetical protein
VRAKFGETCYICKVRLMSKTETRLHVFVSTQTPFLQPASTLLSTYHISSANPTKRPSSLPPPVDRHLLPARALGLWLRRRRLSLSLDQPIITQHESTSFRLIRLIPLILIPGSLPLPVHQIIYQCLSCRSTPINSARSLIIQLRRKRL